MCAMFKGIVEQKTSSWCTAGFNSTVESEGFVSSRGGTVYCIVSSDHFPLVTHYRDSDKYIVRPFSTVKCFLWV